MPVDEKLPIGVQPNLSSRQTTTTSMRRSARPYAILAAVFVGFYLLWSCNPAVHRRVESFVGPTSRYASGRHETKEAKVPLEAHVMSKCPDTRDCLRQMILPAMQRVHDKVDFTLSFVATLTDNDGVDCKHGPPECMGNILELCAFELYPDPKISLGFTMCITKDYHDIPSRELIEDCALEHAVDFSALNDCATEDNGAHGMAMLRESVARTKDAGVNKSCTIRLNNEIYCIRDNHEWTDCPSGPSVDALVDAVEDLYSKSNQQS